MRVARKNKKKYGVISLDIKSIPNGLDLDRWLHATNHGIAIWDSSLGGHAPKLIGRNFKRVKVCDVSKNNCSLMV